MNDDINRLLASACEGEGRSIRHRVDDVVRRGRRRVRIRRSGGTAFSMLAVGGVLAAIVTAWPASGPSAGDRDADPAATDSQPGPATVPDDEVIRRCKPLDHDYVTHAGTKGGGGTDPIDDWSVVVTQAADTWIRAILLSPDERRYAYCRTDRRGVDFGDYHRSAVDIGPDYGAWVSFGAAQGTVPDTVARLTFETPDGTVTDATIVDGFYLWSAASSDWGSEPVWATFYDADGDILERVDANAHVQDQLLPCSEAPDDDFCFKIGQGRQDGPR
jgi:hypothetical protein